MPGPRVMLEKDIERAVCDYAKAKGMLVYKFTSPARSAVPDRLLISRTGLIVFIEFKRPGARPRRPSCASTIGCVSSTPPSTSSMT